MQAMRQLQVILQEMHSAVTAQTIKFTQMAVMTQSVHYFLPITTKVTIIILMAAAVMILSAQELCQVICM